MADSTTTTTSTPQQAVLDNYNYITDLGRTLTQQPYQAYTGELVPELTDAQKAAIAQTQANANSAAAGYGTAQATTAGALSNINANANAYQPYYNQALSSTNAALGQVQANANAAQPGYAQGFGAADTAGNIIAAGKDVAQPYMTQAQGMANAAMPGYAEASRDATAGMTPLEQATYAAQPAYQHAMAGTDAASQGYNAANYQAGIQGYLSPYLQNVVNATAAQMQNINQQQQQQMLGSAIGAGAFGGDRANIGLGALENQQNLAWGQTIGGLLQSGYQNAAQNYMTGLQQQGVLANQYGQLGGQAQQALINAGLAQQQGAANIANIAAQRMAGATSEANLGTAAQNAALQGAGLEQANAALYGQLATGKQNAAMQSAALQGTLGAQYGSLGSEAQKAALMAPQMALSAGAQQGSLAAGAQASSLAGADAALKASTVDYAQKQAKDAIEYQNAQQEKAYPFQNLEQFANLAYGIGTGGGTTTQTTPVGNDISSYLGLGTALLGFLSDERLKDNMHPIGKSFDGQTIYRFNYKGDPKTQVGFSAQEVEKHHPEAVYKNEDGVRFVNYDQATHHAASKGHFHLGGEASMGGLVPAGEERSPYGRGGEIGTTPYVDDPLMDAMVAKAGLNVYSYIPSSKVQGFKSITPNPTSYTSPKQDFSGVGGFLNAGKKFYNSLSPSPAVAASIAAQSSDVANLGSDIGSYSLGLNYSNGGLVPRTHHADGEDTPMDDRKTVSADTSGGGLSSVFSGLGGIIPSIFNKGEPLSDDARMSIIAAGLATAAGTSPSALANIGQGGLTGLQTYANQKKMQYDYQKAQAEQAINARRVAVEESKAPSEIEEAKTRAAVGRAGLYSKQWIPGYGFVLYDNTNPTAAPKRITDEKMQPLSNVKLDAIPTKPGSPDPLTDETKIETKSPIASETSAPPETKIINPTKVPEGYMPKEQFNIQMNPTLSKQEADNAAKDLAAQRDKSKAAFGQLYRLDEMDQQISNLPPTGLLAQGSYATERGEFAKGVNTFLHTLGGSDVFDPSSIGAIENLTKDRFRLGAELSRSIGGKEPGFIVQQSVQANPGAENTAVGYKRITEGLRQAAEYEQNRTTFYEDYAAKFGHLNGAEDLFKKQNPPEMYSKRAILSTIDPVDAKALREYVVHNQNPAKAIKAFDEHYGQGTSNLVLGQ